MTYNPAANGMVERVHHSLKAALMACCTNERWKEQLLWVLLGLHTAPKANGDAFPAEKVYGETLAVPGEFFLTAPTTPSQDLHRQNHHLQPTRLRLLRLRLRQGGCPSSALNQTLQGAPQSHQAYLPDIQGHEDWVTIDRLKPTFLLDREVHEEAGRCPRVPPQYLSADTPGTPTKAGSGPAQGTHRANPRCRFHPMPTVLQE
ncbi:uncharacterized protein [Macrobrachium rosenbergii]|uniref:uncharacterized protein n=1 Tax=Macrobrachium rosenbergii TaxID=79674 RepID=UPI0034D6EF44